MTGPIARILLRVLAGIMIGYGLPSDWATQITNDPDVMTMAETVVSIILSHAEVLVGLIVWSVTEGLYALAKRWGWKT